MTSSRTVPIHPGEALRDEFLVPYRLSASRLARSIGVPTKRITGIIHGDRRITGEIAVLLAYVFKTTPEFWLNLQARHDLEAAQNLVSKERIDGAVALSKELCVG